jgi:hypothetical protein
MRTEQQNIQKSDDIMKSIDATERLHSWFKLHSDFEETKKYLNNVGNLYVNKLFSFLGYHYKGIVENPNILHISAEAWLLGVFGELKKENTLLESKNVSYHTLLTQIKQVIVEENTFLDNMKLLTGIYGVDEPALSDNRVFKMFLVNIQDTKNAIMLEGEKITRQDFDDTLLRTLRLAFNYTLNEFNSNEQEKKSLEMLNIFLEIKTLAEGGEEQPQLTFEKFSQVYLEKKKIKIAELPQEEERKLNIHLEAFYEFCLSSFEELIEEIRLFNKNAGSILFKIKNLVSLKNIKRMYIKYIDIKYLNFIMKKFETGMKNLRLEKVLVFMKTVVDKVQPCVENAVSKVKVNYSESKKWISSTVHKYEQMSEPVLKYFRVYYGMAMENYMNFSKIPRELIVEKIYTPAKNITMNVKNNSINLVISTYNFGKVNAEQLKNYITERVSQNLQNAKNTVFGNDPLVKVNYHEKQDSKEYMSISISKKLFLIDPTKATELVRNIIDKISHLSLTDSALQVVSYTQIKVSNAKTYLLNSYKRFLDMASEDENENDETINPLPPVPSHVKSE